MVEDGDEPSTSARVVLQTALEDQTGFRFALGLVLFLDRAHIQVFCFDVLEKPLMWSLAFGNQWR